MRGGGCAAGYSKERRAAQRMITVSLIARASLRGFRGLSSSHRCDGLFKPLCCSRFCMQEKFGKQTARYCVCCLRK
jgi:hypothetical protein